MKKKEEVFVRINTPKKAKKVIKVLELFKEKYMSACIINYNSHYDGLRFYDDTWCAIRCEKEHYGKTEVSIKELRNILAAEHLKEGDVVVCGGKNKAVGILKEWEPYFGFELEPCIFLEDGRRSQGGCFDTFLRYATEEEKALLEDKPKELTIADYKLGVWYKSNNGSLIYFNDTETTYGFFSYGEFSDKIEWISGFKANGFHKPGNWVEAKDNEVITSLEKEAEKRFGKDWLNVKIKNHVEGLTKWTHLNDGSFSTGLDLTDRLYNKNGLIYYNGKWAELLEEPKSIEAGKWYTCDKYPKFFSFQTCEKRYGFDIFGNWFEVYDMLVDDLTFYREATKEEVEQALIKEAKKRYKVGDNIECLYKDCPRKIAGIILYTHEDRDMWYGGVKIYDNGKWAEIVESSPLTVTLETKDIATLQVIQKTLKELEEKLTKLI